MTNYVIESVRDSAEEIKRLIPKTLCYRTIPELMSKCFESKDDEVAAKYLVKTIVDNISGEDALRVFMNLQNIQAATEDVSITVDFDKIELLENTILNSNAVPNISILDSYKGGLTVTYNTGNNLYAITKQPHTENSKYIIFGLDVCKVDTSRNTKTFQNNGLIMINRNTGRFYFSCADTPDCTLVINGQRIPVVKMSDDTLQNCFVGSRNLLDYYRSNPLMDTRYVMIGNRLLAIATWQECLLCYLELKDHMPEYRISVSASNNNTSTRKVSKPVQHDATAVLSINNHFVDLTTPIVRRCSGKKAWQGGHHASPCQHTVREHIRHYKNGKTTIVKSFIRGKNTNTLELKTFGI